MHCRRCLYLLDQQSVNIFSDLGGVRAIVFFSGAQRQEKLVGGSGLLLFTIAVAFYYRRCFSLSWWLLN